MTDSLDLRIGDAEREAAAERLARHAAAGRLGVEELERRLERAQAAVLARDLLAVEADLPSLTPARRAPALTVAATPGLALPLLLLVAGVALTIAVGHPVAPLFIAAFWLWRAAAWRGRRPGPAWRA
jgi:hypothetical protein